jgi:Na+/H+ antiporter NhaD/arsenite permease-like protein
MVDLKKTIEMAPEEHARLNSKLREEIERERTTKSKNNARDWFTAVLVLVGLFVMGGALFKLLPVPLNLLSLFGLAFLWIYFYESK